MDISKWKTKEAAFAGAIGVFAAGALSAWTLMGAEPGSRADWVAAVGTWVIGLGACTLSYQAATAQLREKHADQRKHLRRITLEAHSLRSFSSNLEKLDKKGNASLAQARTAAGALNYRCAAVKLELLPLNADVALERAVFSVEYNAMALRALIESFLERTKDVADFDRGSCQEYRWMLETSGWLSESAQKLADEADAFREKLE
ncbi:hypothetical protein [Stenotrophomonas maltophilia]|uniref:hypothetical protein n=1 Tax=Stenotrophomonas maltophilia TaxID=40324 RepID=UPI00115C6760|nr:hypothetical protein [Stenotrophomonas maltophilia]